MASIIKLKRISTQSAVPGSLELGEIAVNLFDRRLYVGNSSGVTAVGGEVFKFTSQSSDQGAYLKLLGENSSSSNTVLVRGGTGIAISRDANGSVAIAATGTAQAGSNTVGTASLQDGAVTAAKIANQGLTANTYGLKSIGTTAIADGAVTSAKIASKGIQANNIADASISSVKISAKGIVANSIADGVISSTQIASKGIQANNIADGIITSAMISAGGIGSNAIGSDAVTLGSQTTGNYVATISGTANEVEISGSGSESATVTIGLPNDVTIGQDLTVTRDLDLSGSGRFNDITTTTISANGNVSFGEDLSVSGNTSISGDLGVTGDMTVDGNLTVEGAVTYISSSTVNVDDSMLKLSANNAADTVDTGVYSKYVVSGNSAIQYTGYFRDATNGVFKFYTGLDLEPTTTVDITDTGYALAQVDAIVDGGTY